MTGKNINLWVAPQLPTVPDTLSDPTLITSHAVRLRQRERKQIAANFDAGNYEVAAAFVWLRTMALLKQQLAALGMEFIGELLQRPDIDEFSDVQTVVSETEAISLARDLGIITKLQTMRLLQSQAIVAHFASIQNDATSNEDEVMTREEAISCLRVCVQWVLGHEQIAVAEDFKRFREKLESATLAADAPELDMLRSSPYFLSEPQSAFCCLFLKRPKGASRTRSAECAADCSRILGPVKSP